MNTLQVHCCDQLQVIPITFLLLAFTAAPSLFFSIRFFAGAGACSIILLRSPDGCSWMSVHSSS